MSMLAEKKVRKKSIPSFKHDSNVRGDLWSKDDAKLGQKMLEGMGWSKGKGLGKKNHGDIEPLKTLNNREKLGLGSSSNAVSEDAWTQHDDNFEEVLSNLNSVCESPKNIENSKLPVTSDEEKKENKNSLEKKSKESRARVHYHKFTRGKDLSVCNEDELACILGSRRSKKIKEESLPPKVNAVVEGSTVGEHEVYGGSLKEYFQKKMTELAEKRSQGLLGTGQPDVSISSIPDFNFTPSKRDFSFNVGSFDGAVSHNGGDDSVKQDDKISTRKKRKFKDFLNDVPVEIDVCVKKKKKNKKEKGKKMCQSEDIAHKSSKEKSDFESTDNTESTDIICSDLLPVASSSNEYDENRKKKKKKKKERQYELEESSTTKTGKDETEMDSENELAKCNDNVRVDITRKMNDSEALRKSKKEKKATDLLKADGSTIVLSETKKKKQKISNHLNGKSMDNLEVNESYLSATGHEKKKSKKGCDAKVEESHLLKPLKKMKKFASQVSLGDLYKVVRDKKLDRHISNAVVNNNRSEEEQKLVKNNEAKEMFVDHDGHIYIDKKKKGSKKSKKSLTNEKLQITEEDKSSKMELNEEKTTIQDEIRANVEILPQDEDINSISKNAKKAKKKLSAKASFKAFIKGDFDSKLKIFKSKEESMNGIDEDYEHTVKQNVGEIEETEDERNLKNDVEKVSDSGEDNELKEISIKGKNDSKKRLKKSKTFIESAVTSFWNDMEDKLNTVGRKGESGDISDCENNMIEESNVIDVTNELSDENGLKRKRKKSMKENEEDPEDESSKSKRKKSRKEEARGIGKIEQIVSEDSFERKNLSLSSEGEKFKTKQRLESDESSQNDVTGLVLEETKNMKCLQPSQHDSQYEIFKGSNISEIKGYPL